jgi:diacylglycerol O-acyltransferase / wax synthase
MSQATPIPKKIKAFTMSRADAAWLHMEDPTNLMMITALFTFSSVVQVDKLRSALQERLLSYDRFSMVTSVPMIGRPYWKPDSKFDIENHIELRKLAAPGGEAELLGLVGDLMSLPLERNKPLWKFHLVHGLTRGDGIGSALIVRLHHSIADGIALMKVLLSLTDTDPEGSLATGNDLLEAPRRRTASLVQQANIQVRPSKIIRLARAYGDAAGGLGKLLIESEPRTPFKGKLGKRKSAACSKPFSLEEVKRARLKAGCTVNDLLMACVAGGLRRHLIRLGKPAKDGLNLRAVIPVDLRRPDKDPQLGNRFGLIFLALPVGVSDPRQRLNEVRARMMALKHSPQAVVVLGLLNAVGSIPAEMQQPVVELFGSKATAVVTNVPGPKEPLWLAGERIDNLMFWVPQSGRLGLGLSILTYGGQVHIGVATDSGLTTRADLLAEDIEFAYHELCKEYLGDQS